MTRRLVVDEVAAEELEEVRASLAKHSVERALAFEEDVRQVFAFLTDFPFAKAVSVVRGDVEVRRVSIGHSGRVFFYLVYPSVDFQTAKALDVIHVLAWRHERQAEPNWSARDPFRL